MAVATERVTVRMMRGDTSTHWGFRIHAAQEYTAPLMIEQVFQGGLAERAGLLEGDKVLEISGIPAHNLRHTGAEDLISRSGNNLDLVVERAPTRIWRPEVTPVQTALGDMSASPVKYSLAHDRAPQNYSNVGAGHNIQPRPFGQPQQSHSTITTKVEEYDSPQPPVGGAGKKRDKVEEYLQKTGGLFGTDPKLTQKIEPPAYLKSETLRLIKESETRSSSIGPTEKHIVPQQKGTTTIGPSQGPPSPVGAGATPGAPACDHCGRPIHGVFCKIGNKTLHGDCFKCSTCGSLLKNIGYFMINDKLYCDVHARQQREIQQNVPQHQSLRMAPRPHAQQTVQYSGGDQNSNYSQNYQYHKTTKTTTTTTSNQQPYSISIIPTGGNQSQPPAAAPVPPAPPVINVSGPTVPPPPPPVPVPKAPSASGEMQSNFKDEGIVYACPVVCMGFEGHWSSANCHHTSSIIPECDHHEKLGSISNGSALNGQLGPLPDADHCQSDQSPENLSPCPASVIMINGNDRNTVISTVFPVPPVFACMSKIKLQGTHRIQNIVTVRNESQWTSDTQSTGPQFGKPPARRGRGILKQLHEAPRIPVCDSCNHEIRGPFVMALSKSWCPDHFVCATPQCQRRLLDIGFIEENGCIYCEFCYEKYLAPTCSKCSRAIVGDCLTALNCQWHPECFVCTHCRKPFGNTSFFVEDGQPYCEQDWNQLFTTKCVACQFAIESGDRWVEALGNAYHSDCFNCSVCQKNLEGQSFYAKAGRPYCKEHA